MHPHCYHISPCKLCMFGSKIFGHWLTKALGLRWPKITRKAVSSCLKGLNLRVVGGLDYRGHTKHDIDVIGDERDVPVLVKRLNEKNINNLVHYCGPQANRHSHWQALKNGFLVTFLGNKIYL